MELNPFSSEFIYDNLKSILPLLRDNFKYEVEESNLIRNSKVLSVCYDEAERKFLLIKSEQVEDVKKLTSAPDSVVFYPDFTIKNNRSECYVGFDLKSLENFRSIERNNLDHLKIVVQSLAAHHFESFDDKVEERNVSEYNIKTFAKIVTNHNEFNNVDETTINTVLKKLQDDVDSLLKSEFLVKCLSNLYADNILIARDLSKCIFLQTTTPTWVPLTYDFVSVVISLTNTKFRQVHFQDVFSLYCERLLSRELEDKYTITRYSLDKQIKVLLPALKLHYAACISNQKEFEGELADVLRDVSLYIKYPLLNQEDIYEVVKNYLKSTDYDLVSYELVPLKVSNGHLGYYYHLNIQVNHQKQIKNVQLFAKFIIAPTEALQSIIERGVSKKEDFFYSTFLPLVEENGLGSLLDFCPKCYLSKKPWFLILDDLSKEGYVSLTPNQIVGYDGLKSILSNLAKFNAASILLERILSRKAGKKVTLNDLYAEYFVEPVFTYDESNKFRIMLDYVLIGIDHLMRIMPKVTKKFNISPEVLKSRLDEVFVQWIKRLDKSDNHQNVLSHGDLYISNVLLKYNQNDCITASQLIDFQMLRYCPLGHDIMFFIYTSSSKETRAKYFNQLLEKYYADLSGYIKQFGFDPEVIFSKEEFNRTITFMKSQALMHAHNYSPFMHLETSVRKEIMSDDEKYFYYLTTGKREIIDIAVKSERQKRILAGLLEDLLEVIEKKEY